MNLINFKKKVTSDQTWKTLVDFREMDHSKLKPILANMFKNIQDLLGPDFKYDIKMVTQTSDYLAEKATHYEHVSCGLKFLEQSQDIKFLYPKLLKGNYFVMAGSLYIPLVFLERAPIDVLRSEQKKEKIFVNIMPTFNLTFSFETNEIIFRKKTAKLASFIRVIFEDNVLYYKHLVESKVIPECEFKTFQEAKDHILKMMGFHNIEYFNTNNIKVAEFFNKYLLLDYFKGMFDDFFGIKSIEKIIEQAVKYHVENLEIDMSSLKNRRLVMNEYLINPIYEMYLRLLYSSIEKKENQAFMPTINQNVVITSGFRGLMHAGNFFNNGLPYTNPTINKISQDIYIITDGRLPKSWTCNHPSALGRICPISVSAQKMGSNIVGTNNLRVNYYGRIE